MGRVLKKASLSALVRNRGVVGSRVAGVTLVTSDLVGGRRSPLSSTSLGERSGDERVAMDWERDGKIGKMGAPVSGREFGPLGTMTAGGSS